MSERRLLLSSFGLKCKERIVFLICFASLPFLLNVFVNDLINVHGILVVESTAISKAGLSVRFALLLTFTPVWLGIQHSLTHLCLQVEHILPNSLIMSEWLDFSPSKPI